MRSALGECGGAPAGDLRRGVLDTARAAGATVAAIAALPAGIPPAFQDYNRAVVAAVALSRGVLAGCRREPTRAYAYHYRAVNALLDGIAVRVAAFLESGGFRTEAIPASQLLDWENLTGALSHVRLGVAAGLGFIGRNNLLVAPRFGAGIRLVSILTQAPLEPDTPVGGECHTCRACVVACPAQAIGAAAADWNREACIAVLKDFKKRITNQHICGICVRACAEAAVSR